jgi:endoglucanase
MNEIHINQMGYRPNDSKKAVIPCLTAADGAEFQIVRVSDDTVVYSGKAGDPVEDCASKDTARIADFSSLTQAGEYFVRADGRRSYPFKIENNPYKGLRTALLEMFNYQKCGVDLECGLWSHPACHTSLATVYGTGEKKDVSGGWHDAGDYGRYIVPAAKAVADLLLAHKFSSNPDSQLLNIVWFEIEWMLKMQDEKTGGVYHKVSCRKFDAIDEMPHDEKDELLLSLISATATADFAASMALASSFYPAHKDKLLNAAKRAWSWCAANPDTHGFKNPPDIGTGGYEDDNDKDERFWAACELYAATKDETYLDYIKTSYFFTETRSDAHNNPHSDAQGGLPSGVQPIAIGLGWGNVETYGVIAYLLSACGMTDNDVTRKMKDALLRPCENIMEFYKKSPYGISLGEVFKWGSNMTVANNAMMLILASRLGGNRVGTGRPAANSEYAEAALEHFHYLLGRNPLSQSYITGFGSVPVKNPHHRPSVAKGSAVPGMVAGGPCMTVTRDPAINAHCADAPPAKRYVDHKDSFASNEIAIYWNSPAYFVMAALDL